MTPRQQARTAGEKVYEGRPCHQCGGTQRYVTQCQCVACTRARTIRYRRQVLEGREGVRPTPRREARVAEERFYEGRPCRECGGTQRYVSTGNCVPCARARTPYPNRLSQAQLDRKRASAARRRQARAAGEKFYEGPPCHKCGGTQRYVSSASCVLCVRARSRGEE